MRHVHDGLTETQRAWLRASEAEAEFAGRFTASEIAGMSISEFARLSGRTLAVTPTEPPPERPRHPAPAPEPAPEAVPADVGTPGQITDEDFLAWRAQRTRGGDGSGIMDQGPQSAVNAARRQAERHPLSNANVQAPPRIARVFVNHDELRDSRSATDRLSAPGNVWNGR